MKWFRNRCTSWRRSVALLASGALSEDEVTEVRAHLATCTGCSTYFAELQAVTAPLADWERAFSRVQAGPDQKLRWANAIQQAAAEPRPVHQPTSSRVLLTLWRELIRPCRGAWAGMAVLWIVMWGIHLKLSADQTMASDARPASAPAIWQSIAEQRQVLAELLPAPAHEPAEPPRVHAPQSRPHSQRATRWRVV